MNKDRSYFDATLTIDIIENLLTRELAKSKDGKDSETDFWIVQMQHELVHLKEDIFELYLIAQKSKD